jgi:hypothetical protein
MAKRKNEEMDDKETDPRSSKRYTGPQLRPTHLPDDQPSANHPPFIVDIHILNPNEQDWDTAVGEGSFPVRFECLDSRPLRVGTSGRGTAAFPPQLPSQT